MIISIRTFINTTLLWIFVIVIFWWYTRFVDETAAQKLVHFIGRDKLGNLTVTVVDQPLSEQLIVDKLANIEQICARSVRLYMYDQAPTPQYNYPTYANPAPTPQTPIATNPIVDTTTHTSSWTSITWGIPTLENIFLTN